MSCSEWKKVRLAEVLEPKGYIRGPFGSALRRNELQESGIPVYEQQNAIYNHRNFRFYVNNIKYDELKRFTVKENDMMISCSGTIGRVSMIQRDDPVGIISQALLLLRCDNKKINPKFFYYFLTSTEGQNAIASVSSGSVQVNIAKRNIVENINILLPPISEQKEIAATLSCLDDKIELNSRINKNLEEMAQAIFKRWFVDFEFPDENGNPYKSSGGEMVESELGEIPKGWRVEKVSEGFDISIGKTPPRKEPQWFTTDTRDVKWVSISDMGKSGLYIFDTAEYLTNEAIKKHNIKIVPSDTVILSFKLTIGRVAITSHSMTTNEAIAHFLTTDDTLKEFLYFYLKNFNFSSLGNTSSIATAVNSKVIKQMPILKPNTLIIHNFHHIASDLMLKIKNNQEEILCLINIRDSLLPKLMSGEIRVPCEEAV